APASVGEDRTISYLVRRFGEIGLEPGGRDGSWTQEVSLVSLEADMGAGAAVLGHETAQSLEPGVDFVAVAGGVASEVDLDASPLIFAGYGIVAPELEWNDYDGLDLRGRTVVVLVNDPGYATGDERFGGRTMTYYGRWTYKYEEAKRQGAAGIMIVHQEGPAGYPWAVVKSGWSGPQFMLASDESESEALVQGWISEQTARSLFERSGLDFDSLAAAAGRDDFRPAMLEQRLTLALRNDVKRSASRNVLARLPGRARPEEHVIYIGHWDHLGIDASLEGDTIYNGAQDNASGISGLLELAEAFSSLPRPPERSVLFLALTAEEQGLLGSRHYAADPAWPLSESVAVINVDGLNIFGPTRDIVVVGHGRSELDAVVAVAAANRDRTLRPDPEPEKGYFFRSDHFEFARRGVPSLFLGAGLEDLRYGEDWARARHEQYTAERYHKPGDEWDPTWNLEGAVEDLRLMFDVGLLLADSDDWPAWVEGSEFRQIRD
ncbi:MAG: M28 family metallopeptidase, partial [marine benthic group bacterium]|nr:M28 family metallopeptidase [Gemmatimonadota bacterium]